MCYNYEIDDKQLGMEFPDLTGTLYDSTEWDNNPFYSAFTFRKAPVIINLTNSDRVQNPVRVKQHYKGARIPKWTKSMEDMKKIRTQNLDMWDLQSLIFPYGFVIHTIIIYTAPTALQNHYYISITINIPPLCGGNPI